MKTFAVLPAAVLAIFVLVSPVFSDAFLTQDGTGTYVGGLPKLAPHGTYVGGTPTITPDGFYSDGIPKKKNTLKKWRQRRKADS